MSIFRLTKLLVNVFLAVAPAASAADDSSSKKKEETCKSIPGSADWPSQHDWGRFNESLGGRLLQPAPPGAVCHPGHGTYDPEQCAAVVDGWSVYRFHTELPTSVIFNQFSNDSCLPDQSYPCDNVGYPAFVVNATTTESVQLAVKFAKKNNVRLIVKGTGHDFIGRSIAPHALSIWTHHMKGIEHHDGSFKPKGCKKSIEGNAVTAKAGTQMIDLYRFTDQYGEVIVGGGGESVGVGGYVTGGGHSILAPRYGLAADQVLEMELVTPSGKFITANECQNEEFFWAMRGGGGSTFGVMTSVTFKTHPSPKMLSVSILLIGSAADPKLSSWIAHLFSKAPYLESEGISAYMIMGRNIPGFGPDPVAGVLGVYVMQDTENEKDFFAVFDPVVEGLRSTFPDSNIFYGPQVDKFGSYLEWFGVFNDTSPTGSNTCMGGRLLSVEHLTGDVPGLADLFGEMMDLTDNWSSFIVSGKGVHEAKPRGGSNAVLPAWRKTILHTVVSQTFEPLNKTAEDECNSLLTKVNDAMTKFAPDSGAYMNEHSYFEKNYQEVFWGDNYKNLLKIKKKVDPHDVLWCHPCVGNEGWEEVGNMLCRV